MLSAVPHVYEASTWAGVFAECSAYVRRRGCGVARAVVGTNNDEQQQQQQQQRLLVITLRPGGRGPVSMHCGLRELYSITGHHSQVESIYFPRSCSVYSYDGGTHVAWSSATTAPSPRWVRPSQILLRFTDVLSLPTRGSLTLRRFGISGATAGPPCARIAHPG